MSDQDVGSKTLSALKWGYGGAVVRALIQLIVQMALARKLGPEVFGQATAIMLVIGISWIISEGGFGAALVQKKELLNEDISSALGWILLLSLGIGLLVFCNSKTLADWMGSADLQRMLIFSIPLIPILALGNIPASLMRRNLDARRGQIVYISSYVLGYAGVGVPLALAGAGAWSLIAAAAGQALLSLAFSYYVVRHTLKVRLSSAKYLLKFGSQVTLINATGWLSENADRFLVNRFWGAAALGEYTAAATLSKAPAGFIMSSAQSVTLASASRVQDNPNRLGRSYLALICVIALLTGPLFAFLALHAAPIVQLVYGSNWNKTAPLFAAFCASIPFYSILSVSGPVLWAIGAVRQDLYIQLITLLAIVLSFYALRDHDLLFVAWIIPAVYIMRSLSAYWSLKRRLRLEHRRAMHALFGGFALTGMVVIASLLLRMSMRPLPAMLSAALICSVLALTSLRTWPTILLPPEFLNLLRNRAQDSPMLFKLYSFLSLSR